MRLSFLRWCRETVLVSHLGRELACRTEAIEERTDALAIGVGVT